MESDVTPETFHHLPQGDSIKLSLQCHPLHSLTDCCLNWSLNNTRPKHAGCFHQLMFVFSFILLKTTVSPLHPQLWRCSCEQAEFPSKRCHPPAWGHCRPVLPVSKGRRCWSHNPGGWRARPKERLSCGQRGRSWAWWSGWRARRQPGGSGCWCCCCWSRQQQSRNGSGRRPLGPPSQKTRSTASTFSLSPPGPGGRRREKSMDVHSNKHRVQIIPTIKSGLWV